jgi:hypothetical protein
MSFARFLAIVRKTSMQHFPLPPALLAIVVVASIGLVACSGTGGPPKKTCYPAKGKLLVKSQPAAGALVVLRPQTGDSPEEWPYGFPRAQVQADGTFELETYGTKDGAPAGDYTVLVSWPETVTNPADEEASPPDRLGGRYNDPATSKLKAKIDPKPTEIPPIQIP